MNTHKLFNSELAHFERRREAMAVIFQWVKEGKITAEQMAELGVKAWKFYPK